MMPEGFGHDVISVFDVWEDTRDYLAQLIESDIVPTEETSRLFDISLTAGAEDWNHLIDCATSLQSFRTQNEPSFDGTDVLAFAWPIIEDTHPLPSPESWRETDRLVELAKQLEKDADLDVLLPSVEQKEKTTKASHLAPAKKKRCDTSHYWSEDPQDQNRNGDKGDPANTFSRAPACDEASTQPWHPAAWCRIPGMEHLLTPSAPPLILVQPLTTERNELMTGENLEALIASEVATTTKNSVTSPYFTVSKVSPKKASPKRAPRGTVSCVPFPPLTSTTFGLVQEKMAHDAFWLLIAITFLIRTTGKQAIPVFDKIKERFPSPVHLADPSNGDEILDMIRHLGLSAVRLAYLQRYARGFLETPPSPHVRYRVKNYDRRDVVSQVKGLDNNFEDDEKISQPAAGDVEDPESWEIGHLTKGAYAIDSWRIFCRDELLGRAQDWTGKGREAEFQPEWMRVMPADKELRAYLRWMWMREGWEWDPVTGDRTVVREEMQRAVNEGRVEYDETGGLRILPKRGTKV